jgi:tetratricopeptide (TPR) repeat protein
MGATLPILSKYFVTRPSHLGGTVGLLYGVNTLGAVLGSFAAGFVLIPALAFEKSIKPIDNFIRVERGLLSDHFYLGVINAKANLYLGTVALKANRLKQAAEAFKKSLSGELRYAHVHNNLGFIYERTGKYDEAVNQYQLALKINPKLVSPRMNMANTLLKQKRYQEAIESYRQVEKLRPDLAVTNYSLGLAYFKQNQWAKAEKEWMRAIELKPDFSQAQQSLDAVRNKMKDR